jgi:hypothetical protein
MTTFLVDLDGDEIETILEIGDGDSVSATAAMLIREALQEGCMTTKRSTAADAKGKVLTCPICKGKATDEDLCLCRGYGWVTPSQVAEAGYRDDLAVWRWRVQEAAAFLRGCGYTVEEPREG